MILTDDLNYSKKSARWIPRILSSDQKDQRLTASTEFLKRYRKGGAGFLGSIITMNESAVAFHTPDTKNQSKQWLPKGTPGPLKARVQVSRKKQMVFAFFNNAGLVYQHYAPLGTKANAGYLVGILRKFLKVFKRKCPDMAAGVTLP